MAVEPFKPKKASHSRSKSTKSRPATSYTPRDTEKELHAQLVYYKQHGCDITRDLPDMRWMLNDKTIALFLKGSILTTRESYEAFYAENYPTCNLSAQAFYENIAIVPSTKIVIDLLAILDPENSGIKTMSQYLQAASVWYTPDSSD